MSLAWSDATQVGSQSRSGGPIGPAGAPEWLLGRD